MADKDVSKKVKLAVSSSLMPILTVILAGVISALAVTHLTPYEILFNDRNVYASFSQPKTVVNRDFYEVLDYLGPLWTSEVPEEFSREDKLHLQDIQNVYKVLWIILITSLIAWLMAALRSRQQKCSLALLNRSLSRLEKWLLAIIAAESILLVLSHWQLLFQGFHKLLFPGNTYWMLDPATSTLIKYFPDGVFQLLFVFWLLMTGILIVVLSRLLSDRMFREHRS